MFKNLPSPTNNKQHSQSVLLAMLRPQALAKKWRPVRLYIYNAAVLARAHAPLRALLFLLFTCLAHLRTRTVCERVHFHQDGRLDASERTTVLTTLVDR